MQIVVFLLLLVECRHT